MSLWQLRPLWWAGPQYVGTYLGHFDDLGEYGDGLFSWFYVVYVGLSRAV